MRCVALGHFSKVAIDFVTSSAYIPGTNSPGSCGARSETFSQQNTKSCAAHVHYSHGPDCVIMAEPAQGLINNIIPSIPSSFSLLTHICPLLPRRSHEVTWFQRLFTGLSLDRADRLPVCDRSRFGLSTGTPSHIRSFRSLHLRCHRVGSDPRRLLYFQDFPRVFARTQGCGDRPWTRLDILLLGCTLQRRVWTRRPDLVRHRVSSNWTLLESE